MSETPIKPRLNWEQPEHVGGDDLAPYSPKVYQAYIKGGSFGVQGFEPHWFAVGNPEQKMYWGPYKTPDDAMDEAERLQRDIRANA